MIKLLPYKPMYVVLDVSRFIDWKYRFRVEEETLAEMLKMILYSYPFGIFADGIWELLETAMDFDHMSDVHLQNLDIAIEELCFDVDAYIRVMLGGVADEYRYYQWLNPWSVVLKRNI